MMDDLAAARAARSLPQNLFGGANRYTPSPLSRRRYSSGVCLKGGCLGARPAWSAPPSPCARGSAARAGRRRLLLRLLRVRAPPPSRSSPRLAGAGGFQLGFAHACLSRLSWARAMRPPAWVCLHALSAPLLGLGRKPPCAYARAMRPPAWVCRCRAAAPCLVLGASRPAPLSSAPILPAAACSRYRGHMQPRCQTAPKSIKTTPKSVKKRAFCAAYRRKRHGERQQTVR